MKYIIFFFLIIQSNIFAQDIHSGIVTYKLDDTNETRIDVTIDPIFELIENSRKNLFYSLKFKESESIFLLEEFMSSDLEPLKFVIARSMVSSDFYCNLSNDSLVRKANLGGKDYLVYSKLSKVDWELFNETKIIDGFVCYKAVAYQEIIRDSKIMKFPITAWYCPQIPFTFGPKGFNGLPGLILELHDLGNNSYFAEKIKLFTKEEDSITIDKLKGIYITEAECKEISSNITLKSKDNFIRN